MQIYWSHFILFDIPLASITLSLPFYNLTFNVKTAQMTVQIYWSHLICYITASFPVTPLLFFVSVLLTFVNHYALTMIG